MIAERGKDTDASARCVLWGKVTVSSLRSTLSCARYRWVAGAAVAAAAVAGLVAVAGPSFAHGGRAPHEQRQAGAASSTPAPTAHPAVPSLVASKDELTSIASKHELTSKGEVKAATTSPLLTRSSRPATPRPVTPAVTKPRVLCSAGRAVVRWAEPAAGTGITYAVEGDEQPSGSVRVLAAPRKGYQLASAPGWVRAAHGTELTTIHFPPAPAGCAAVDMGGSSAVSTSRSKG